MLWTWVLSVTLIFFSFPAGAEPNERRNDDGKIAASAIAAKAAQPGSKLTQVQAFNCDFDDNIFFSDAKIMVWDPKEQKEIPVTTQDWAIVKNQIGKTGEWKDKEQRPESFRYFRDNSEFGEDVVKVQVEKALKERGEKAYAPSLKATQAALSKPETLKHFYVITAREHHPRVILKGFKVLFDRGLIPAMPLEENIFPVGWKGLPEEFRGKDTAESKAKVMIHILDKIEQEPIPADAMPVENREGTGQERLHLWGFSDDDFDNFRKAKEVLSKEVAKGRWPHIKISLFFTGLNNPDEKKRSEVIRGDGTTRPTRKREATRMGDNTSEGDSPLEALASFYSGPRS